MEAVSSFPTDIQVSQATRTATESANQFLLKFSHKESPLLLQTPVAHMPGGFHKWGRRLSCDLVFPLSHAMLFEWIQKLETFSIHHLFENQQTWFQGDLTEEEIDNLFVPPMMVSKLDNTFTIRCHLGSSLRIFDHEEKPIPHDDKFVTAAPVVCLMEIVGIRCSSKNFKLEIEIKQIQVLQDKSGITPVKQQDTLVKQQDTLVKQQDTLVKQQDTLVKQQDTPVKQQDTLVKQQDTLVKQQDTPVKQQDTLVKQQDTPVKEQDTLVKEQDTLVKEQDTLVKETQNTVEDEYEDEGEEGEEGEDAVVLLYNKALQKGVMARDLGVLQYLEGKGFGNTQLLLQPTL